MFETLCCSIRCFAILLAAVLSLGCAGDDGSGGADSGGSGGNGAGGTTQSSAGNGAGGMAGARSEGADDSVAGTITLPGEVSDVCAMVAVDDDTTGSNSSARRADGTYLLGFQLISGDSFDFSIPDVPGGSYYLWGYVDTDASVTDPEGDCEAMGGPATGDYFGYFDSGLREPSSANVDVPHADGQNYDFELEEFP